MALKFTSTGKLELTPAQRAWLDASNLWLTYSGSRVSVLPRGLDAVAGYHYAMQRQDKGNAVFELRFARSGERDKVIGTFPSLKTALAALVRAR